MKDLAGSSDRRGMRPIDAPWETDCRRYSVPVAGIARAVAASNTRSLVTLGANDLAIDWRDDLLSSLISYAGHAKPGEVGSDI